MTMTDKQINDGVKIVLTETVSAFLTYIGESKSLTPNQASAEWRLRRVSLSGAVASEEFPTGGDMGFAHIWNNRASLFPPPAFFNTYSTQFDGVNDFGTAPDSVSLRFEYNNTFTWSLWFKTSASGATQGLFAKQTNNATATGYYVSLESNGRVTCELRNAGTNRIEKSTTASFNDGAWHNLTITYSGNGLASGLKIYVDGAAQATTTAADTLAAATIVSAAVLNVAGNKAGTSASYRGNLDEFAMWDVEFTAGNVTTLYNSGKPLDLATESHAASRRAWWRMGDNNTFPTLTDLVGANNLTMTNMTSGDIETAVP